MLRNSPVKDTAAKRSGHLQWTPILAFANTQDVDRSLLLFPGHAANFLCTSVWYGGDSQGILRYQSSNPCCRVSQSTPAVCSSQETSSKLIAASPHHSESLVQSMGVCRIPLFKKHTKRWFQDTAACGNTRVTSSAAPPIYTALFCQRHPDK